MVIDRKSWPWLVGAGVILAAAGVWYIASAEGAARASGGSWPGLIFAIAGSAIIVFCMLLSARKALRTAPLGRAHHWMQAHVWLGLISYPLIWFHAAFRTGGTLTTVLMILFTVVWLSGIVGLLLQHTIPTILMRKVPRATIHDQIERTIERMREEAESIVALAVPAVELSAVGAGDDRPAMAALPAEPTPSAPNAKGLVLFRRFHAECVLPVLTTSSSPMASRGGPALAAAFMELRGKLPEPLQGPLSQLEQIVRQRLHLERQRRLHRVLHGWLLIHVPLSYGLLALSVIHAVMALKYRGIG